MEVYQALISVSYVPSGFGGALSSCLQGVENFEEGVKAIFVPQKHLTFEVYQGRGSLSRLGKPTKIVRMEEVNSSIEDKCIVVPEDGKFLIYKF